VATAQDFSTILTVVRPVHKLQALYNPLTRNKQETRAMALQNANTAKSVQNWTAASSVANPATTIRKPH
jgi:hypothetical protein